MLYFLHVDVNLLVIILVRSFLEVSRRMIGHVLVRLHFQSLALGMGKMVLVFHDSGHEPFLKHRKKNFLKIVLDLRLRFLSIS